MALSMAKALVSEALFKRVAVLFVATRLIDIVETNWALQHRFSEASRFISTYGIPGMLLTNALVMSGLVFCLYSFGKMESWAKFVILAGFGFVAIYSAAVVGYNIEMYLHG